MGVSGSASASSAGSGAATDGAATDSDDSDNGDTGPGGDGPLLDVAPGQTGGGDPDGAADECTNVDILFVIDDSGSMADNQDQLIASFPGFIAGIPGTTWSWRRASTSG